jgi:hypothetical protein
MASNQTPFSKLNGCRSILSPVHVFMSESPHRPTLQSYDDRLTRKVDLIWNNQPRNRLITNIARTLTEYGLPGLAESGMVPTELDSTAVLVDSPWIAILVESSLHGRILRQRLPGWDLWQEVPGRARRQHQGSTTGPRRMIVTMLAAAHADDFAPDAVIVAHGGRGMPKPPGDSWWGPPRLPSESWWGPQRQIHVFDFIDTFDIQAERETYSRLCRYVARPWTVVAPTGWLLWATGETTGLSVPPPVRQSHRSDCPLNESVDT